MFIRVWCNRIREIYHRRLRRIDTNMLWPALREMHNARDVAEECFRQHVYSDFAWDELTYVEIDQIIAALP